MRCGDPGPPGLGTTGTPPVRAPGRGVGTRSVRSYAVIPLRYATRAPRQEPFGSVPRDVPSRPVRPGPSAADVVAQLVALGLELGQSVLDDVADADDGGELAVGVDDRHV